MMLLLKDYGFQKDGNIHCCFRYVIAIYDQMCECDFGNWDDDSDGGGLRTCLDPDPGSRSLLHLDHQQVNHLMTDAEFEFDSAAVELSVIPGELNVIARKLRDFLATTWSNKIERVALKTNSIYLTKLDQHPITNQIMTTLRLHKEGTDIIGKNQIYSVMDIEVIFKDLSRNDLVDYKINLPYCNYLIYRFFKEHLYQTCGFFLGSYQQQPASPSSSPSPTTMSYFCHLYLVPLNLSPLYYYDSTLLKPAN